MGWAAGLYGISGFFGRNSGYPERGNNPGTLESDYTPPSGMSGTYETVVREVPHRDRQGADFYQGAAV